MLMVQCKQQLNMQIKQEHLLNNHQNQQPKLHNLRLKQLHQLRKRLEEVVEEEGDSNLILEEETKKVETKVEADSVEGQVTEVAKVVDQVTAETKVVDQVVTEVDQVAKTTKMMVLADLVVLAVLVDQVVQATTWVMGNWRTQTHLNSMPLLK